MDSATDISSLMQSIANLRRDEIALDYYNTNVELLEVNNAAPYATLPVCLTPGQTVEVVAQVTGKEQVEDFKMSLNKDGEEVVFAEADDSEEPSSISLIYRETLAGTENAVYNINISSSADDFEIIEPKNLQIGFKIYENGY